MSPGVCVMCNKWTPSWHDASLDFDHCPHSAIKNELLVHLGHLWIHHKHAAIETVSWDFKISLLLLNCYNLVFQERNELDMTERLQFHFWIRKWQPTPVSLPGESHGQRSLWRAMVHRVTESRTRLSDFTFRKEKQHDLLQKAESDWSMCFL